MFWPGRKVDSTCTRQGEVITLYATAGVSLKDSNPSNPLGLA